MLSSSSDGTKEDNDASSQNLSIKAMIEKKQEHEKEVKEKHDEEMKVTRRKTKFWLEGSHAEREFDEEAELQYKYNLRVSAIQEKMQSQEGD